MGPALKLSANFTTSVLPGGTCAGIAVLHAKVQGAGCAQRSPCLQTSPPASYRAAPASAELSPLAKAVSLGTACNSTAYS